MGGASAANARCACARTQERTRGVRAGVLDPDGLGEDDATVDAVRLRRRGAQIACAVCLSLLLCASGGGIGALAALLAQGQTP